MFLTLLLVIACAVAATTDVAIRRVPNALTFGLAAAAVLGQLTHGIAAGVGALAVYAALLLVGSIAYGRGWFGGGDVKLLAAGTICAGWPGALTFVLATALAGGVLAVLELARTRQLHVSLVRIATAAASGNLGPGFIIDPQRRRLPYAVAIAAGAFTLLASETIAPWLQLTRV